MENNIFTTIIAIVSSATSVGAWKFYESKLKLKAQHSENPQRANERFILDLQSRVTKLEALLVHSSEEKDNMREIITKLSSDLSALNVKIQYLESENNYLKKTKKQSHK
jgi:BMFP domain-containing protein YqiC